MKGDHSLKVRHYRILLSYLLRQWRGIGFILGLTLISSVMAVAQPWPFKLLIDNVLTPSQKPQVLDGLVRMLGGGSSSAAMIWVGLVGFLGLAILLLNAWLVARLSMAWANVGQRSVLDLSEDTLAHLMLQDSAFYARYSVGDCLSRITDDTYAAYQVADRLLVKPLSNLSTLLMVGLVSWRLNSRLTLIAFVVIPILTLIAIKYGDAIRQLRSRTRVSESDITAFTLQILKATPLVQAYQTEAENSRHFVQLAESSVSHAQRHQLYGRLFQLKGGVVGAVTAALILLIGSLDVLAGSLTVGGLVVMLNYVNQIRSSCDNLFVNFGGIKSLDVSVDRLFELLDHSPAGRVSSAPISLPLKGVVGQIDFDQVIYRYPDNSLALDRLSLRIDSGETVAIVGRTGAGKSTLVSLLLRFLDPTDGRVLIDGIDIRRMALSDLRSQIAFVPQDPMLAPMSVSANIAYSQARWHQRRVIQAARDACAYDFIQQLPKGFDTKIGQGSTRLSGGEKQRISLARAFYQQAPILILDEPTSALDTRTEAELMASLKRLTRGKTVIMVAHRLSTIKLADRIVVLENGHIAEQGTHQELITSRGLFHRLHVASSSADRE